ncbi:MAG: DUF1735 domain-containing protein [Chitinophagaceae bacterium]|nr:MAG: DUF1735 domain-containing protein [Chitinophagaceae bacterium]
MQRLNKMFSVASAVLMASALLSGCVRDKEIFPKDSGDANRGQIVNIVNGGDAIVGVFRDVAPANETFELMTITRSPKDQSQLNMPLTVKVTKNNALITDYNTAHTGSSFVELPADAYTLSGDPGTITFQPGETVKTFSMNLDKSKLDLSKQYALGYSITEVGSTGQISGAMKNVLYNVGVKNPYDGIYSIQSGLVTRYNSPGEAAGDALSGSVTGNPDLTLSTVGATTVLIGNLRWAGGTSGVAGIDNLRATVDPATNLVTMTAGGNPSLKNWPGKVNRYDPATKTFYLAFHWNPTGAVREYEMVIKYNKSR